MTHLVVVGGSDAGISAALRARELDRGVDVTVVVAALTYDYEIDRSVRDRQVPQVAKPEVQAR